MRHGGSCVPTIVRVHVRCIVPTPSSYGPRASSKLTTPFSERGQFLVDFKFAPFAGAQRRARRGAQAADDEKRLQTSLAEAVSVSIHLEAFPKAVLEAFVVVLQEDGGRQNSGRNLHSSAMRRDNVVPFEQPLTTEPFACTLLSMLCLFLQVCLPAP
jgi:ribonuclease PH